jgi:transposase
MDTSTVEVAKHTLTRGGKRLRPLEEKRRIVEEVLRGEESVAAIARRHEVNANLVFGWKRLYEKGLLEPSGSLVPVRVRTKAQVGMRSPRAAHEPAAEECVEIDLGAGKCMRLRGKLALAMLERVLAELCSR